MDAALANRLAASVRAADPDRYFSALFAPAPQRPYLFALYAFNAEVSRIAETVREPMLGAIRLEWWRETAEGAARGNPRNHDVARGLVALFADRGIALADLEAIIAVRAFDSSAETFPDFAALKAYVDATSGAVMRLAAQILGGDPGVVKEAGLAYGLAGLVRSVPFHNSRHKLYFPLDILSALHVTPEEFFHLEKSDPRLMAAMRQTGLRARDHFFAARSGQRPRAALAAILPAALVPVYLRRMTRDVTIHRRQMALLSAAMKKRL
ncbi:MAG: squalene/phytoene synthase family protein [Alphaproteobacteria bacterium]